MKLGNSDLFHVAAIAVLLVVVTVSCAAAHVILDPTTAAPGTMLMAQFKVGHGCSGLATTGLKIEIPAGVTDVMAHDKPGWNAETGKVNGRTVITWSGGSSAPDKPDSFAVMFTLPATPGKLIFPATQTCGVTEEHWSEAPDGSGTPLHRPAPVLMVAAATATAPVTISDAWIRALPASVPSGGYFALRNGSDKSVTLTGADSPACGMLMLHKSQNTGGMSGMADMAQVVVPAGGEVRFAPGGYHLMCMDAKAVLKPGAKVPVTLQFADGAKVTSPFAVRNAAGK
jgi:copper(I)-binding protein